MVICSPTSVAAGLTPELHRRKTGDIDNLPGCRDNRNMGILDLPTRRQLKIAFHS